MHLPELTVGVTRRRIASISAPGRRVHKAILRAFGITGRAPDLTALSTAVPQRSDLNALLTELHEHDVLRLDEQRCIRVAYPFSDTPTAHMVAIEGGPVAYAMCAIDALGIAEMLGRNTAIRSADPVTGKPITVTVQDGKATWRPETAVVFVGSDHDAAASSGNGCCPPNSSGQTSTIAAADLCCNVVNFFTSLPTADTWLATHPDATGVVLAQDQALRLGVDTFAHLLND